MDIYEIIRRTLCGGYAGIDMSIPVILVCMCFTTLIAIYIHVVYKRVSAYMFYNRNFNMSLIAMAVITSAIILTIQSNIVISLGMVGALSIIRFRTAIKDPLDLVYLFWAISAGIMCGAGFSLISMIASIVLTVVIVIFSMNKRSGNSFLMCINAKDYTKESAIMDIIGSCCISSRVRSQNVTDDHMDMTVEVTVREKDRLLGELMEKDYISSVSFVENAGLN